MRIITVLSLMSILFAASGCVPSLHSIVTEETARYDPNLAGTYRQEDMIWVLEANAATRSYTLRIEEGEEGEGKTSILNARLAQLNGQLFLELSPQKAEVGDWVKIHLVPAYTFWKFERTERGFLLAAVNPETVTELLENRPDLVKHENTENGILFTDSAEGLQKFLLLGLNVENFYGQPQELTRAP